MSLQELTARDLWIIAGLLVTLVLAVLVNANVGFVS